MRAHTKTQRHRQRESPASTLDLLCLLFVWIRKKSLSDVLHLHSLPREVLLAQIKNMATDYTISYVSFKKVLFKKIHRSFIRFHKVGVFHRHKHFICFPFYYVSYFLKEKKEDAWEFMWLFSEKGVDEDQVSTSPLLLSFSFVFVFTLVEPREVSNLIRNPTRKKPFSFFSYTLVTNVKKISFSIHCQNLSCFRRLFWREIARGES